MYAVWYAPEAEKVNNGNGVRASKRLNYRIKGDISVTFNVFRIENEGSDPGKDMKASFPTILRYFRCSDTLRRRIHSKFVGPATFFYLL